ncbi:MAG: hypothetical protein ABIT09_12330 [Croceibacterium sp.]
MTKLIVFLWDYLFDHEVSPLRNIPNLGVRHLVLQMLGWMWSIAFSIAISSYTLMAFSLVGHIALFGAAAITVATYTSAAKRPQTFMSLAGRFAFARNRRSPLVPRRSEAES